MNLFILYSRNVPMSPATSLLCEFKKTIKHLSFIYTKKIIKLFNCIRTFLKKNDATLRVYLFVCLHFSFSCPDSRTQIHLAVICKFIMLISLINKIEYSHEVFIRFHFSDKVWKKTRSRLQRKGGTSCKGTFFWQPRFRHNNSHPFCPHSAFFFAHLSVSCVLKPNPLLLTLFKTLGSRDLTAGRGDSCEHMRSSRLTLFTVTIKLDTISSDTAYL